MTEALPEKAAPSATGILGLADKACFLLLSRWIELHRAGWVDVSVRENLERQSQNERQKMRAHKVENTKETQETKIERAGERAVAAPHAGL